jgi:hypothetical protein
MDEFIVNTCHDCPFCNNDNEYGRDSCNHPFNFGEANREGFPYNQWGEMPKNKVHENCPLKKNDIKISINENTNICRHL